MSATQWQIAKRTTAIATAGVVVLLGALLISSLAVIGRLADEAEALAAERQLLAAKAVAAQVAIEVTGGVTGGSAVVIPDAALALDADIGINRSAVFVVEPMPDDAPAIVASLGEQTDGPLATAIRVARLGEEPGSRPIDVDGSEYLAATAPVLGTDLAVVVAGRSNDLWPAGVVTRGRVIAIALVAVLFAWAVGFLTALGAHGALPDRVDQSGADGASAHDDTRDPDAELEWAVLCVTARLRDGDRIAGITLDDAPDELSEALDALTAEAQEHGLQPRGRMPDRVVLVDFGEAGRVGSAAMSFATTVTSRARAEVRSRAIEFTAGVAGGAFGDDGDDDAAWGGRSLALAETLAETSRENTVLAGDRVARALGSDYVFRDASRFWVRGVGDVGVVRVEPRA